MTYNYDQYLSWRKAAGICLDIKHDGRRTEETRSFYSDIHDICHKRAREYRQAWEDAKPAGLQESTPYAENNHYEFIDDNWRRVITRMIRKFDHDRHRYKFFGSVASREKIASRYLRRYHGFSVYQRVGSIYLYTITDTGKFMMGTFKEKGEESLFPFL